MTSDRNYRVGIDVGTNSIGFAAIEIDETGMPLQLLNTKVLVHDSGVDPNKKRTAETRLATAGVARRTRKLIQRRTKRLFQLDTKISELGWPIVDPETLSDPYAAWHARAALADQPLQGAEQLKALSIAIRHIARHRGWRSPYSRIESLFSTAEDSDEFKALKQRVTEYSGVTFEGSETPGQVIRDAGLSNRIRLRSAPNKKYGESSVLDGTNMSDRAKEGLLGGKLRQSDNANEIRRIGMVQGLSDEVVNNLIRWVFASETPKGKASLRAGRDDLPGQRALPRAPKAHLKFQEFRIVSYVANIRVIDPDNKNRRELSHEEREAAVEYLMTVNSTDLVTLSDVAEQLKLDRNSLSGVADKTGLGEERVSANPPINQTANRILNSKIKPLVSWWTAHEDADERQALVTALSNAEELKESDPGAEAARQFLTELSDEQLAKLDGLSLPAGRAAYSVDSLSRLTNRMRASDLDHFNARKVEFDVPDDWQPDAEPIGQPVGNPGVDRVTKAVNRWLSAVTKKWGPPVSVNIEHVRSALGSESQARAYERAMGERYKRMDKAVQELSAKFGIELQSIRQSDKNRILALQRQNCQCAYCGQPITWESSEMDHIVPRKGQGSSNQRSNLAAVCRRCNQAKSNIPFSIWARQSGINEVTLEGAVARVREWNDDPALDRAANYNFKKDVISRLKKTTEDEPIDNRSIESVAWMAVELRHRIEQHYKKLEADTKVRVFRGTITAEARHSTGFEGSLDFIGGHSKTRLDRRHHVMDAVTIALMSQTVAQVLAERSNIRHAQRISGQRETWRDYWGSTDLEKYRTGVWRNWMNRMKILFNEALAADAIPVTQNLRLRLGNAEAHDATIRPLIKKPVGAAWSVTEIDRAESPQLWCALTREPDFDSKQGLPENPDRRIRVKSTWFGSQDEVGIFNTGSAAMAVRDGYAEIGSTIHHARIYKIPGKKPSFGMIRVFSCDLSGSRHADVFSVNLAPQSITMRTANKTVRTAVLNDAAEYLGWIVAGDEVELDIQKEVWQSGAISDLIEDFGAVRTWRVVGFNDPNRLKLRPTVLAGEGLKNTREVRAGTEEIIGPSKRGWLVGLQTLMRSTTMTVVRRDSLGNRRAQSSTHLPITTALN